jgi:VanZ family protein
MLKEKSSFFHYQFPAIFWALFIFAASSIPSDAMPVWHILSYDKLIHAAVYAVFCVLLFRALRYQRKFPFISQHAFLLGVVLTSVYGATDELHQLFIPGRYCDIFDFLADTFGGVLAIGAIWIRSLRRPVGARVSEK